MDDVFLSYSSKDRERVSVLHAALTRCRFSVFWDQELPAAVDWDTWIRRHLNDSRCVIAVWTAASIDSKNVRHEAQVADEQGKLLSVLLDPISPSRLPMGLYPVQAVDLTAWAGDATDERFAPVRQWLEKKLTPEWAVSALEASHAALAAERSRREAAESQARVLADQIARDTVQRRELEQKHQEALAEVSELKTAAALGREGGAGRWLRRGGLVVLCAFSAIGGYSIGQATLGTTKMPPNGTVAAEVTLEQLSPEDCRKAAIARLESVASSLRSDDHDSTLAFRKRPDLHSLIRKGWSPAARATFEWLKRYEELCIHRSEDGGVVQCNWSDAQRQVLPGLDTTALEDRQKLATEALYSLRTSEP